MNTLTPRQSADVIRYYHDSANPENASNGARTKVALARAAVFASRPEESILPDGRPLLDVAEMANGLEYLLGGRE
jgi:hypothetical protein